MCISNVISLAHCPTLNMSRVKVRTQWHMCTRLLFALMPLCQFAVIAIDALSSLLYVLKRPPAQIRVLCMLEGFPGTWKELHCFIYNKYSFLPLNLLSGVSTPLVADISCIQWWQIEFNGFEETTTAQGKHRTLDIPCVSEVARFRRTTTGGFRYNGSECFVSPSRPR